MADSEMKRLSRKELLEMLIEQGKENDRLKQELEKANRRLQDKSIAIKEAGSVAQAALTLNNVFAAADAAAEQYLQVIRERSEAAQAKYDRIVSEAKEKADAILADAEAKAERMLPKKPEKSGNARGGKSKRSRRG